MSSALSIVRQLLEKESMPIDIRHNTTTTVNGVDTGSWTNGLRHIARLNPQSDLYSTGGLYHCEVDSWLSFAEELLTSETNSGGGHLGYLNTQLSTATFLVGHTLTIADIAVYGAVLDSCHVHDRLTHLKRWFAYLSKQFSSMNLSQTPEQAQPNSNSPQKVKTRDKGKFIDLPGAEMGKVIVRFPPEASGYLHIGHAKAALLNQYYQHAFQGKLILRFDDTNPSKESLHFEEVITKDLEYLKIKPDIVSHTSDFFDKLIELCEQMIKDRNAYADDTDGDTMKKQREERLESKNRGNSISRNLELWSEMLKGSQLGQICCMRAKIDMQSDNGALRDPTLYRCKTDSHVSTGTKYKAYPTYDFACPIVDSLEGVTHALRSTEYQDRDAQYNWILDKLQIRKPFVWAYSRLNLQNTVLSKRRLTWLVDQGAVESWEDPRFPTVRGVFRHGMTVEGLTDFIIAQGGSRSVVQMEWDKIWAFNKKIIDPIAPRYTALDRRDLVPLVLKGATEEVRSVPAHPKNTDVGTKEVAYGHTALIEQADALLVSENETVTLINWGNCVIDKIYRSVDGKTVGRMEGTLKLTDTNFKATKLKLTWLTNKHSTVSNLPVVARNYGHILSKAILGKDEDFKQFVNYDSVSEESLIGDHNLANVKSGDIIQIQRKGFFICDRPYQPFDACAGAEVACILILIPDGHKSQDDIEKQQALIGTKQGNKTNPKSPIKSAPKPSLENSTADSAKRDAVRIKKVIENINISGDVFRKLKSDKQPQDVVKAEVVNLLRLKEEFKVSTGVAHSPEEVEKVLANVNFNDKSSSVEGSSCIHNVELSLIKDLVAEISACGDSVRGLKQAKKSKDEITVEVNKLLALKERFKSLTGSVYSLESAGRLLSDTFNMSEGETGAGKENKKENGANKKDGKKQGKNTENQAGGDSSGKTKQTKLGLGATMEENFADWYTQVITKAELIEYYDVSGCYILRPLSFFVWETIQHWFDTEIKKLGVENTYFPIFVSKAALEREKSHLEGFAAEVAWVTRSSDSDLAQPIAVRPTSETVMYPSYAKWIQSHRDLPLKLNQWNNVVRWEFKNPTPFLRTREFLWQEGHTAFETAEEAKEEVLTILDLYAGVYEQLLAIPVVKGRKTEKEKFPGGDFTTTVEAFIEQSGRGVQGATSHHLGQNFSKMFNITIENPEKPGEHLFVYQNSWGLSTRSIGAMVMVHGDNKGLVLPPRVAQFQVVVVPCGVTNQAKEEELNSTCESIFNKLKSVGIRCKIDLRSNYSPGWKFNHWEVKGIPIRLELGPKDLEKNQVTLVRRDSGSKLTCPNDNVVAFTKDLLGKIQTSLYDNAKVKLTKNMVKTAGFGDFCKCLDEKKIILSPFCGIESCEDEIKKESAKGRDTDPTAPSMGAKTLCVPFEQPGDDISKLKCINPLCKNPPLKYALFGRSY